MVPSVIMNYINEADYAKTLTMANSKYIGRVIGYQMDLNESLTSLYRKIIRFSKLPIPDEYIESLEYTFTPPKSLNNVNMSDILGNADQLISIITKALLGEADNSDDTNILKDILYNNLLRAFVPSIDWQSVDDAFAESKIQQAKLKSEKSVSVNNSSSEQMHDY